MTQTIAMAGRELLVFQAGCAADKQSLAQQLQPWLSDWTIISHSDDFPQAIKPQQFRQLLGQNLAHALFDARDGFHLDAFLALAGTLQAGSCLLLLLPHNVQQIDLDSLRWNDATQAIAGTNFQQWLHDCLQQQAIAVQTDLAELINKLQQIQPLKPFAPALAARKQQQACLQQILNAAEKLVVLTAKRGRGKSALAGMLTQHADCWYSAPSQAAANTLRQFAKSGTPFFAPDQLLAQLAAKPAPQWLIIDEAAMIPLPLLQSLLDHFPKVLLTSTIEGYEGTAQALRLKLLPQQDSVLTLSLTLPMRWAEQDGLEQFTDRLMFADFTVQSPATLPKSWQITNLTGAELIANPTELRQAYQLLQSAHYRTTPTDLRRLLDGTQLQRLAAKQATQLLGLLLSVVEGGLDEALIEAIWQGRRRPKGNLVAQALVAHAGERLAAKLHSWRINRLAVMESCRRQGIASQLLQQLTQQAQAAQIDYLSVSFAYHPQLYPFWQHNGFVAVHVGSYRDKHSGSYAVMMLKPLSAAGEQLTQTLQANLQRNWFWQRQLVELDLPIQMNTDQQLSAEDYSALVGFAAALRPLGATYPALQRLRLHCHQQAAISTPILNAYLTRTQSLAELIAFYGLSGKNALVTRLRQDVGKLLPLLRSNFYAAQNRH